LAVPSGLVKGGWKGLTVLGGNQEGSAKIGVDSIK